MGPPRALRATESEVAAGTAITTSTRIVSGTLSHYEIRIPRDASPFVAQNETGGDVTFALVDLVGGRDEAEDDIDAVLDAVKEAQAPDFTIVIGGDVSVQKQASEIVEEDFGFALFLNLPVTLVILVLAFGAVVAAFVPLTLALAAVVT